MQNKCNCGCQQGFVPVNGNWDFNNDCGCRSGSDCRSGYGSRKRRSNGGCQQCGGDESAYTRERDNECQCERCSDAREVVCCDQNTYVRDMADGWQASCEGKTDHARSHDAACQCEQCVRNRRNNGCQKCSDCETGNNYGRNGECEKKTACRDNADAACARSRKNRTVGMINVEMQELDEIFESESALRAGTLFPELHKPMNGYCPYDDNCGTCKQQAAFAAWEMRLYLNTHPNDREALALFRKLCKEAGDENYATTFLTDDCCASSWSWVKNPWPWEYDCQCGSGSDCRAGSDCRSGSDCGD